jgi:hypothetical protein
MNEVPPGRDEPDDVEDLYRRASARDDSRPSEWVRHTVLTHAAHRAAGRAAQDDPARIAPRRAVNQPWRRPAIFGTLAAAALAGLLIAPHFLPAPAPNVAALSQAPASPAPQVAAPQAAPQVASQDALQEARQTASPQARPSQAPPSRARAEERSIGTLADQSPPPAALSEAPSLAKAGASAGNAAASADSATSLAAKNAPAKVPSMVGAQRAAAAPMAEAAAPASPAARLWQAAETGDAPKLQMLLDKQADVDARDESGRTALLLAALHGQAHAVDVLLAHGADPNAADANGDTPLKVAIEAHQQAIAAALQRAGAR